tara:strand:- start:16671 stop:17465 length:795 start_codon:yes stop_codon:yes gene_type:complete
MNPNESINVAMVLAAGLGTRIGSQSLGIPKPLIKVAGVELIEYTLKNAISYGVDKIIINTYFKPEMIEDYLENRKINLQRKYSTKNSSDPIIETVRESKRLETGGGVRNVLPKIGINPFFVMNSDSIFYPNRENPLERLALSWDDSCMDGLLLICPRHLVTGYDGKGDFTLRESKNKKCYDEWAVKEVYRDNSQNSFVFTGVQILHPRLFRQAPMGKYSLNLHYDEAIDQNRLFAVICPTPWYHVGNMKSLHETERDLVGCIKL